MFVDIEGRSAQVQYICKPLSEMEVTRQEQRFYVKIAVLRGRNAKERHSELKEVLGNRALPSRTVTRWAAAFQRVRVASADMR